MTAPAIPAPPAPAIPLDRYLCDLCLRYRPGRVRNFGVDFYDRFWACVGCMVRYRRELAAGGRRHYAGA